jgi:hypothetical protein
MEKDERASREEWELRKMEVGERVRVKEDGIERRVGVKKDGGREKSGS